jgi:type IV secretory pathway TrbD component
MDTTEITPMLEGGLALTVFWIVMALIAIGVIVWIVRRQKAKQDAESQPAKGKGSTGGGGGGAFGI